MHARGGGSRRPGRLGPPSPCVWESSRGWSCRSASGVLSVALTLGITAVPGSPYPHLDPRAERGLHDRTRPRDRLRAPHGEPFPRGARARPVRRGQRRWRPRAAPGHTILLSAVPVGIGFAVLLVVPTRRASLDRCRRTTRHGIHPSRLLHAFARLALLDRPRGLDRGRPSGWLVPGTGRDVSSLWRRWGHRIVSHPLLALALRPASRCCSSRCRRGGSKRNAARRLAPFLTESVRAIHMLRADGACKPPPRAASRPRPARRIGRGDGRGWMALRRTHQEAASGPAHTDTCACPADGPRNGRDMEPDPTPPRYGAPFPC